MNDIRQILQSDIHNMDITTLTNIDVDVLAERLMFGRYWVKEQDVWTCSQRANTLDPYHVLQTYAVYFYNKCVIMQGVKGQPVDWTRDMGMAMHFFRTVQIHYPTSPLLLTCNHSSWCLHCKSKIEVVPYTENLPKNLVLAILKLIWGLGKDFSINALRLSATPIDGTDLVIVNAKLLEELKGKMS